MKWLQAIVIGENNSKYYIHFGQVYYNGIGYYSLEALKQYWYSTPGILSDNLRTADTLKKVLFICIQKQRYEMQNAVVERDSTARIMTKDLGKAVGIHYRESNSVSQKHLTTVICNRM